MAVAIGFAISFSLALVAYRRRWLINPITQVTGILYTIPSIAAFFLLLPITGRGNNTALIALVAYVAADHLPQRPHGARQRARRRPRTPGAGWG